MSVCHKLVFGHSCTVATGTVVMEGYERCCRQTPVKMFPHNKLVFDSFCL